MFSIYDLDKEFVCFTGRNSKTEEEAVEAIIDFVLDSDDIDSDSDRAAIKESDLVEKKEWLNQWKFKVMEHKRALPDGHQILNFDN